MAHPEHIWQLSHEHANAWLELAIENILMEYPHMPWIVANAPTDYVLHRESHPTFFGSFDWHSCVEMYWVAARLMRLFPGLPDEARAMAMIDDLLTPAHIAREAAYCRANPGFERPYGWGWLLKLQHELGCGESESSQRWAETLRPLSDQLIGHMQAWLPKMTYPQRLGMHANTAFALTMAWPEVRTRYGTVRLLIVDRARQWFGGDRAYPFAYEPSGADFLSGGLTEAVLMQRMLPKAQFDAWIGQYLPAEGSNWLQPASVSDASDGQLAHLHGLNLSRAWALGELAAAVPERTAELRSLRSAHIAASMGEVTGSHYMVSHWLAAYALLLLTEPDLGREITP